MSGPDFTFRLDETAIRRAAEEFATHGRVRVAGLLHADAALALYDALVATPAWTRTFYQKTGAREIDPDQLATLAPSGLAALEAFARAGSEDSFRYLYDAIRIPADPAARAARGLLVDRFVEAAADQIDIVRRIVGNSGPGHLDLDAMRYLPGHFLTRHDDGHAETRRVAALVYNLSPRWNADWGGLLQFHDSAGDIARALTPVFNSLHLFAVPQVHSVSMVTPLAPIPRISVAGWLVRD